MRRLSLVLLSTFLLLVPTFGNTYGQEMPMPMTGGRCGTGEPSFAFCDTFDQPYAGGGRTGQLDPMKWSISRLSGFTNPGQGQLNWFGPSDAMHCRVAMTGLVPDNDYFVCGAEYGESNHFMEAFNDNGSYVYNSARIRQPFDFADRTGRITFDVDAKTAGPHSWWVELWITDQPVSGPHDNVIASLPANAIGLAFYGTCGDAIPSGDAGSDRGAIHEVHIVRDYSDTVLTPGAGTFKQTDCYATGPDMFNHFEVRISQQHLEVWATDAQMHPHAGPGTPPVLVATVDDLNLPFTRGYVHLQHTQYSADKAAPGVSRAQTYHWDNVGFDGPVLPVPAQYSIPDAMTSTGNGVNLGYNVTEKGLAAGPLTFSDVNFDGATSAMLTFNTWFLAGKDVNYRLNGGDWHTFTTPGKPGGATWKAATVPVSLSELQPGNNTVDFAALNGDWTVVANIDLVLPGATTSAPSTAAPVAPAMPAEHNHGDMAMPPAPSDAPPADGGD
jgi:hypothetical protein